MNKVVLALCSIRGNCARCLATNIPVRVSPHFKDMALARAEHRAEWKFSDDSCSSSMLDSKSIHFSCFSAWNSVIGTIMSAKNKNSKCFLEGVLRYNFYWNKSRAPTTGERWSQYRYTSTQATEGCCIMRARLSRAGVAAPYIVATDQHVSRL